MNCRLHPIFHCIFIIQYNISKNCQIFIPDYYKDALRKYSRLTSRENSLASHENLLFLAVNIGYISLAMKINFLWLGRYRGFESRVVQNIKRIVCHIIGIFFWTGHFRKNQRAFTQIEEKKISNRHQKVLLLTKGCQPLECHWMKRWWRRGVLRFSRKDYGSFVWKRKAGWKISCDRPVSESWHHSVWSGRIQVNIQVNIRSAPYIW